MIMSISEREQPVAYLSHHPPITSTGNNHWADTVDEA